jgi:hypothetical protein
MREYYSHSKGLDLSQGFIFTPVLLLCLVCWIAGYLGSSGYPIYGTVSSTILWNKFCVWIPNKEVAYSIGATLTIGGALLLSRANYALALIREKTNLPLLIYLLLISTNTYFFPLNPISLGVFCLILAIYQLFQTYHNPYDRDLPLNCGLLIGVGSIFWIYLLWFLPIIWLGMYMFRSMTFRNFLATLIGVSVFYWCMFVWCLWNHDFSPFVVTFSGMTKISPVSFNGADTLEWVSVSVGFIFTAIGAFNIMMNDIEDSLRSRQYLYFLISMAVWSFVFSMLFRSETEEFLETACIPASIIMAHFFTVTKGRIRNILFFSMIVMLIAFFFIQIWNSL